MKLTKTCLFLSAMTAMLIGSASSVLANDEANLRVEAKVKKTCTISTNPVSFVADYDPVAGTTVDGSGSVVIACTKGSNTPVGLGLGQRSNRTMSNGTDTLAYQLYKDAPGGVVWGNEDPEWLLPGVAVDNKARTISVHAQIAANQDKSEGTYVDIVVATVNF
jgi:spore coat protein U-like protein